MAGDGKLTGNPGEDAADRPGGQPAADMIELRLTGEQIDLLRREGEVGRSRRARCCSGRETAATTSS
jgi:hypothetical protein